MRDRHDTTDTRGADYTSRLSALEGRWWKRALDVQAPYRWNLRRLGLGFTLDLGCGLGRNLVNLGGRGVGVDHNEASVATARQRGLEAFTPEDFHRSPYAVAGRFDSLLLAHVAEHLPEQECVDLLRSYVEYVRPGGRLVVICPQERGYATDASHVRFLEPPAMGDLVRAVGGIVERELSFPFPRAVGKVFPYNEFVVVGRRPGA